MKNVFHQLMYGLYYKRWYEFDMQTDHACYYTFNESKVERIEDIQVMVKRNVAIN